jgi:hypothetical protein
VQFDGRLISPGGAASLLGVRRGTIDNLEKRGHLRVYRGPESKRLKGLVSEGHRWVYIPLEDVYAYAERIGRPILRRVEPDS